MCSVKRGDPYFPFMAQILLYLISMFNCCFLCVLYLFCSVNTLETMFCGVFLLVYFVCIKLFVVLQIVFFFVVI